MATEKGQLDFGALNADHHVLLSLVNQLMDALETGQSHEVVSSILNVLAEYVDHHVRSRDMSADAAEYARFVCELRNSWLDGSRTGLRDDDIAYLKNWLTEWAPVADNGRG